MAFQFGVASMSNSYQGQYWKSWSVLPQTDWRGLPDVSDHEHKCGESPQLAHMSVYCGHSWSRAVAFVCLCVLCRQHCRHYCQERDDVGSRTVCCHSGDRHIYHLEWGQMSVPTRDDGRVSIYNLPTRISRSHSYSSRLSTPNSHYGHGMRRLSSRISQFVSRRYTSLAFIPPVRAYIILPIGETCQMY